jgi:hypothetical protein
LKLRGLAISRVVPGMQMSQRETIASQVLRPPT